MKQLSVMWFAIGWLVSGYALAAPVIWPQPESFYTGKDMNSHRHTAEAASAVPAYAAVNVPTIGSAPAGYAVPVSPYYGMPMASPPTYMPMVLPAYAPYPQLPRNYFPNGLNGFVPSMPDISMPSISMPIPNMGNVPFMNNNLNNWNPFPWGNGWSGMPFSY